MIDIEEVEGPNGPEILTHHRGADLLENPLLNKGTEFSYDERRELGLLGLLPPHESGIEEQLARTYEHYCAKTTDLERHIYLRSLQDRNETLFYSLLKEHITEMMPVVYTPVVGAACQQFSHLYRRPRGLFIPYPHREEIEAILDNRAYKDVDVIVVTDGERILGLGDQGSGGMGIPIGKLSLYTICGGIHPGRTLPVLLDAGTNNKERLDDPLYLGWRHERVRGQDYYDFVDMFVTAVKKKLPGTLLQWEDFANANAFNLLDRYRDQLCSFNDDIQGTAAVTYSALLAGLRATGRGLTGQRIVILGAGSAGVGIADLMLKDIQDRGLNAQDASSFYLLDSQGLVHDGREGLVATKQRWARPQAEIAEWTKGPNGEVDLAEVVRRVKPTALIGVSGKPNNFPEAVVREMAKHVERPIIFPLSNPTSQAEAKPVNMIAWTEGRALIGTGSPFAPVQYGDRTIPIGQCNNSYIFPGLGLATIALKARRVSDEMFLAAARALSEKAPVNTDPNGSLLPPLEKIREVSSHVALAVGKKAVAQGYAPAMTDEQIVARIRKVWWEPSYRRIRGR